MTHRPTLISATLAIALVIPGIVAAKNAPIPVETDTLFQRLERSGCEFFRNGSWHDSAKARDHLERKTRYLMKKKADATSEDVIELVGTKSSSSGKPYQVRCAGRSPESSAQWLTRELQAIRQGGG